LPRLRKTKADSRQILIAVVKGILELGYLPVVQWTQNNTDHPSESDKNLEGPGRSEGTVGDQRHLFFRRKLIGR